MNSARSSAVTAMLFTALRHLYGISESGDAVVSDLAAEGNTLILIVGGGQLVGVVAGIAVSTISPHIVAKVLPEVGHARCGLAAIIGVEDRGGLELFASQVLIRLRLCYAADKGNAGGSEAERALELNLVVAPSGEHELEHTGINVLVGVEYGAGVVVLLGVFEVTDNGDNGAVIKDDGYADHILGLFAVQGISTVYHCLHIAEPIHGAHDHLCVGAEYVGKVAYGRYDSRYDVSPGYALDANHVETHVLMIIVCGTSECPEFLLAGHSGAQCVFNLIYYVGIAAVYHGVGDFDTQFGLVPAVGHYIAGYLDLLGGFSIYDVLEEFILIDFKLYAGLFKAGDNGGLLHAAQGVFIIGLGDDLTAEVGGQQVRAAAKVGGIGRDGAEAGIPLFGAAAKAVKGLYYAGLIAQCYGTIESGFVLEQHILLGHTVAGTLLQRHRVALLFLQIIVLLLEYAAPFGEVGKGILLGLYVTHRNGGVCCLFGKPFVDGLYLRV